MPTTDFDGDEMNMHVPQTLNAKAELAELLHVRRCMLTPQTSSPTLKVIQDTLVGAHLLCAHRGPLRPGLVMQLLLAAGIEHLYVHDRAYTGPEVFALLLPPTFRAQKGPF